MANSLIASPQSLGSVIHTTLSNWHKLVGDEERGNLLLEKMPASISLHTLIEQTLNQLSTTNDTGADILKQRFFEGKTIRQVAIAHHASRDQINRWQRTAINELTQMLWHKEITLREAKQQDVTAALPAPSYTKIFGVRQTFQAITNLLLGEQSPHVVTLAGIGGIGKTAMAHYVASEICQTFVFDHLIWLTVGDENTWDTPVLADLQIENLMATLSDLLGVGEKGLGDMNQLLSRIRHSLKATPHLIVIDNLEADSLTKQLVDLIHDWGGPSKFLLTSRTYPDPLANTYSYSVSELPYSDAVELIRHQAGIINVSGFKEADEDLLATVFNVTGGNPLALKMVVGLATVMPLDQILAEFAGISQTKIQRMYQHIYWKAWQRLSPSAQKLLRLMPLVAESGGMPAQLAAFSGLDDTQLWASIGELTKLSLLEVRGNIRERYYGIHRLTATFLQTEINRWEEKVEG